MNGETDTRTYVEREGTGRPTTDTLTDRERRCRQGHFAAKGQALLVALDNGPASVAFLCSLVICYLVFSASYRYPSCLSSPTQYAAECLIISYSRAVRVTDVRELPYLARKPKTSDHHPSTAEDHKGFSMGGDQRRARMTNRFILAT